MQPAVRLCTCMCQDSKKAAPAVRKLLAKRHCSEWLQHRCSSVAGQQGSVSGPLVGAHVSGRHALGEALRTARQVGRAAVVLKIEVASACMHAALHV